MTPVAAAWTVREAVDRIVQLGLTSPDSADAMTSSGHRDDLDQSLLDGYDSLPEALAEILEEAGIGFQVGTDDDVTPGYEADAYGSLLEEAAQCTGGLITITDVEMGQDDGSGPRLEFRCNDKPCSWPVELRGEYLDLMAFTQYIDDLNAPPRVWDSIDVDESEGCDPGNLELRNFYFFGERTALRQLATDFGVKLVRLGD
ncbi:hypothetical protein ACTMTJ_20265 [Phytohabitans sp. LJ34]|uniref:hypothetical protein n=1 Tax=Phytohabitans sp. LJ34 TaxID=3452217 RepID=UPI003F8A1C96